MGVSKSRFHGADKLRKFTGPDRLVIVIIAGLVVLGFYFYVVSNNSRPHFSEIKTPSFRCTSESSQVDCLTNHNHNQTLKVPEQRLSRQASYAFNKGLILAQSGKVLEALQYYDKALAEQPLNPDLLVSKGDALSQIGRYSDAIKYYDKALAEQPMGNGNSNSNTLILSHKANDLYRLGRYNQAVLYYNKALMLEPDDPDLLINTGNALFHTANYSGAIKYYDKALTIYSYISSATGTYESGSRNNSTLSVIINKASALFQLGNYSGAIRFYDKALAVAPYDIAAQKGKEMAERAIKNGRNETAGKTTDSATN